MQTWDVRVEGRNHALRLEGRERRVGFTTVRRVRARTAEEAGEAAVELVRTDPIWFGRLPEENAGERSVSALEVTLLDEASAGEAGPSGEYEFFDEFPGGPLR